MELAIPLLAMGGLYIATNQDKTERSGFTNRSRLPNVDVPDQNFPEMQPKAHVALSTMTTRELRSRSRGMARPLHPRLLQIRRTLRSPGMSVTRLWA